MIVLFVLALLIAVRTAAEQPLDKSELPAAGARRCVVIEVFIRGDGAVSQKAKALLKKFAT